MNVAPVISVPDIRDYQIINAELKQKLDQGHPCVRLTGVEGQRLLVSGLTGPWKAVVEIEGNAGPELAAGLNAPNLRVICWGNAADGAGSRLSGGTLVLFGSAGAVVGYAQRGGRILAHRAVGPRAGLNQSGGLLVLLDQAGPLAAERQSGGIIVLDPRIAGPHLGHARRGGRVVSLDQAE